MKHFSRILVAAAVAAIAAMPLNAQPRGGSRGNGGGGASASRGSSMSSSRGSSSSSSRSYSAPSRSSSAPSTRSYSAPSQSQTQRQQSAVQQPQRSTGSSVQRGSSYQSQSQRQAPSSSYQRQSVSPSTQRQVQPQNGGSQSRTLGSQPQTKSPNGQNGTRVVGGQTPRNMGQTQVGGARQFPSGRPVAGQQRNFAGDQGPRHVDMNRNPGMGINHIAPRHLEPMDYNRPSRFWGAGPHYFGHRVHYLPSTYIVEDFWGVPYYLLDGIYYRNWGGYYYVSRPPFGVFFEPTLVDLALAACDFAYYYNVNNTYNTINENAQTITEQNAIIAQNNATIAQQNSTIALNSERASGTYKLANSLGLVQSYADASTEYFYEDGVFFIKDANGKYVTIVPPAGALVRQLPEDYETVTLGGQEYYKVDDTVYRSTVIDGAAYFEVLGQMTGALADQYNQYK